MFAGPGGRPTLVAVRGGIIEAGTVSEEGTECRRTELVPAADILDGGLEIDQLSAAYTPDGFVHLLCQVNHRHHVDFRYMRVRLGLDADQFDQASGSQL
jgi:hypothetical protein